MKTKIIALLGVLGVLAVQAQITNLYNTATHTNYSQSAANAYIWINGVATNRPYTAVVTNAVSTGDPLAITQQKQDSNNAFMQGEITNNAAFVTSSVPLLNPLVVSLATNYWGTASNYLGTVTGLWSNSLVSVTNYATPGIYWDSSAITTSSVPASLTHLTNGSTTGSTGYIALYGVSTNGVFGAPLTLNINSNTFYTGTSAAGWTLLGAVTNITSLALTITNSYAPQQLWASYQGTNYWPVLPGFQTTNLLYLALVATTNNPPIGGMQSLTLYNVASPGLIGANRQFHGEDFTVRNLTVEGSLSGVTVSGGGGLTNLSFTVSNAPYGTPAAVTNTGVIGAMAYFTITLPAGLPGTNFVTVNQFSNVFLSSFQSIPFSTNYAYWGASNYLARVNGLYKWLVAGGDDGRNPPNIYKVSLVGSYTGTNGWFALTNGFSTSNYISVAVISTNPTPADPGSCYLYTVDHYELLGRTNGFFGQYVRFGQPTDPNDAATKSYADSLFANAFNQNFSSYSSNGWFHTIYSSQNFTVFDMAGNTVWIPINGSSYVGTNFSLTTYATNLNNGFYLQMSTNLALVAGFHTITNWTTNTVSGVTTFTTPMNYQFAFYRLISSSSSSSAFYVPLALNGGALFPSNTWSLATITNGMNAGDIITVNSNGLKLVDVWMSNSTPVLKPHW